MCGIAGILNRQASTTGPSADRRRELEEMLKRLRHRGPDQQGLHVDPEVALGARRLRIVDLEHSDQPLANETDDCHLVFNGEIYNHRTLRSDLQRRGHRFRTRGDGEVILHLYEERGPDAVRALDGMFAFALWDAPRKRLLLARDRLGQKPLYVAEVGGRLLFASEPGAIRPLVGPPEPTPRTIRDYLTYGYVPAPRTIDRRIAQLRPGTHLVADPDRIRETRYWTPPSIEPGRRSDWDEAVLDRLARAVEKRLMSDVPLGILLSGGLDSSLIATCAAQLRPEGVRTFTAAFDEASYGEQAHARAVADDLGTDHVELPIRLDPENRLPRLVEAFGEPFADSSALATHAICERAREEVVCVLTGDGGDELFGGYPRLQALFWTRPLRRAPGTGLLRKLPIPGGSGRRASLGRQLRKLVAGLGLSAARAHDVWVSVCRSRLVDRLLRPEWRVPPSEIVARTWSRHVGPSDLERCMAVDRETYLPGDILTKTDRTSMAVGLEARSPFLDTGLLQLATRLPTGLKVRPFESKVLLRRLARKLLPPPIAERPKQGFAVPIDNWFRGPLRNLGADALLGADARITKWIRPSVVQELWAEHQDGRIDRGAELYAVLMLELWARAI